MIRYNAEGTIELERQLVPLVYGQKEKWLSRITQDPDLTRSVQVTLPRISFSLQGLTYDATRAQNRMIRNLSNTGQSGQYVGVPYDFNFSMTLYARNIEDGLQILEQILPTFNPDYTMTLNLIDDMNILRDVAIVLDGVQYTVEDEGIASDGDIRLLTWDLSFTVKAWLFPSVSVAGLIKRANTYIFDSSKTQPMVTVLRMSNTNSFSYFSDGEQVFQGDSWADRTAQATVVEFDRINLKLYVKDAATFSTNVVIIGHSSGAQYNLSSYYIGTSNAAALISVSVDPFTANINDQWTANTIIKEAPYI